MKMQRQGALPWVIKSVEPEGIFRGYASTFNVTDDHGDQIMPGAFVSSLEAWRQKGCWPKMLWQHDPTEPIGWWRHIFEDDQGLFVEGQLLLSLKRGQEAYEMMKNQMIDGLSIGCRVLESEKSYQSQARCLKDVDLVEISLVTFAANSQAKVTHIKSKQNETSKHLHNACTRELLTNIKQLQDMIKGA